MRVTLAGVGAVDVGIRRKRVKNITLRVYPDGAVRVTVPFGVSDDTVRKFVDDKKLWLEKHVLCAREREIERESRDDMIRLLGAAYPFRTEGAAKSDVFVGKDEIVIRCAPGAKSGEVLDAWWRGTAADYFDLYVKKWLEILKNTNMRTPDVRVRKMKSRWGSCTCKKAKIRFNYYLLCAPPVCVEYVVLHELAHLLYPDHGDRFKAFLTKWMPDWRERKKRLRAETRHIARQPQD